MPRIADPTNAARVLAKKSHPRSPEFYKEFQRKGVEAMRKKREEEKAKKQENK